MVPWLSVSTMALAGRRTGSRGRRGRMIGERPAMTVRENVHQLIDALPEDRLAEVRDHIADLRDEDPALSAATAAAIEEGLDDLRNGRAMSLTDYRRTRGL